MDSAVLLTCIKVPHCFKTFDLSILNGCLRQVSIFCQKLTFAGNFNLKLSVIKKNGKIKDCIEQL